MSRALWPTELSRHGWPPRDRTAQYLRIRQAPSTSWVVASGRWRCRSPRCDPARAFKARCRAGGAPSRSRERRSRPPPPRDGQPFSKRSPPPGGFTLHGGRRRTRIPEPFDSHPPSRQGPPPGDFISGGPDGNRTRLVCRGSFPFGPVPRRAENSNPTVSPAHSLAARPGNPGRFTLRAPPEIRTRNLFLLREAPLPSWARRALRVTDRIRTGPATSARSRANR